MHLKLHKLPERTAVRGLRPLASGDVAQVLPLLNNYLLKFELVHQFSPVPQARF